MTSYMRRVEPGKSVILPESGRAYRKIVPRQKGAFNVYTFAPGLRTIIRRRFERQLFNADWELKEDLSTRSSSAGTFKYTNGTNELLLRPAVKLEFLKLYHRLYAARVRFEEPVAFSIAGNKGELITRIKNQKEAASSAQFNQNEAFGKQTARRIFYELGKMHGAGVAHGHPHLANILLDEKGNVTLIDPKFLCNINAKSSPQLNTIFPRRAIQLAQTISGKVSLNKTRDIARLLMELNAEETMRGVKRTWGIKTTVELKEAAAAYNKGVKEGKRKTRWLRATDWLQ
ncbi:MAG: hypothetical protein V1722_02635 [Candidatus Micrarchaeota archaeon]